MQVAGRAACGSVSSFYRPGIVPQLSFAEVKSLVHKGEFADQHALVIGGSRGLGEITAKLIAAGGGNVCLTYRTGKDDAQKVCENIVHGDGQCNVIRFSSEQTDDGLACVEQTGFVPTHVYYFATRRLARTRHDVFDPRLFSSYVDIYLTGFADLHRGCARRWTHPVSFFFPSSVAVQEHTRDLLEYSCAKAAAEALCESLNTHHKQNHIQVVRLPMVATELSRGLIETDSADAADVMLPIVRSMQSAMPPQEPTPS